MTVDSIASAFIAAISFMAPDMYYQFGKYFFLHLKKQWYQKQLAFTWQGLHNIFNILP